MATWDDVRGVALALPEMVEDSKQDRLSWSVRGKGVAWERPLRKSDLAALGADAPDGPVLCAHVADEGVKQALCADQPDVYFTTPHFNGYPAVLVRLDLIGVEDLRELITDAWLAKAPKRLAASFLAGESVDPR